MSGYAEALDPTAPPGRASLPLAPGVDTLEGKTLGLLSNQKVNADEVLDALAAGLQTLHGVRGIVRRVKRIQSQAAPPATLTELVEGCDAVITGVGD